LTILKVHSGDEIEFEGGWKTRLTGIDAPDEGAPGGAAALRFTRELVEGQRVAVFTLSTDNTAAGIVRDADGMPFAEIHLGPERDIDLGVLLLSEGLARVDEHFLPDHLAHYPELEAEARLRKQGIWGRPE
jgi:endonuclease YncB( thermonuclease family)